MQEPAGLRSDQMPSLPKSTAMISHSNQPQREFLQKSAEAKIGGFDVSKIGHVTFPREMRASVADHSEAKRRQRRVSL